MILIETILIAAVSQLAPTTQNSGYLGGVVVRAGDGEAVSGAEVVLSVRRANEFVPMAKTVTDANGKFIFEELPIAPDIFYKTGASWGGIYYPGPTTRLTPSHSTVGVKLTVNEPITEPSPLIARRLEVTIRSKPGVLEVSEAMTIANPTDGCYVGKLPEEGEDPETLCLHIPDGFEQVTFDEEYYGRHFTLAGGRLVTGIPWTPGEEQLRYTYVLRNEERQLVWTRPLDLPCDDVTIRVVTETPDEVTCSLTDRAEKQSDAVVYHYTGSELEAGHEIRLRLGKQAISWFAYAKWGALVLLMFLVIISQFWRRRRSSCDAEQSATASVDAPPEAAETRTRGHKPRSVPLSD